MSHAYVFSHPSCPTGYVVWEFDINTGELIEELVTNELKDYTVVWMYPREHAPLSMLDTHNCILDIPSIYRLAKLKNPADTFNYEDAGTLKGVAHAYSILQLGGVVDVIPNNIKASLDDVWHSLNLRHTGDINRIMGQVRLFLCCVEVVLERALEINPDNKELQEDIKEAVRLTTAFKEKSLGYVGMMHLHKLVNKYTDMECTHPSFTNFKQNFQYFVNSSSRNAEGIMKFINKTKEVL